MIKDLVIVGGGPSALSAAIYTSNAGIDTTIYEKDIVGGLVASTSKIDNYPGFPDGITGYDLSNNLKKQVINSGTKIYFGDVKSLEKKDKYVKLIIDDYEIDARAVLIASGTKRVKINIPGEAENYSRGVSYCATCDGAFYKGKKIAVIGGGDASIQETLFLTKFASHIDVIARHNLHANRLLMNNFEKYVNNGQISVHENSVAKNIIYDNTGVKGIEFTSLDSKNIKLSIDGVFIFAGLKPNTKFLDGSNVFLDEKGFVINDKRLMTSLDGVFASGDVCSGSSMQIATAVGDGVAAAISIENYLNQKNN